MSVNAVDVDAPIDKDALRAYAEEVKKRLELEKEKEEEDTFLRSSLRGSNRLKAIENYRKLVRQGAVPHLEVNEAFESDEVVPSTAELAELINYLKTKIPSYQSDEETEQWKWLLGVLSDPLMSKAFLMHDCIAIAYEKCARAMDGEPRARWPILPGAACDVLEAVEDLLIGVLKKPVLTDTPTLNRISQLHNILNTPKMRYLFVAMDGLANTWLFDMPLEQLEDEESEELEATVEEEATDDGVTVPGCYSTLAYDEFGRDSFSEQGVRLKYVVFQKRQNEFLGATVSVSGRSILVARIVNGGLAQKTGLLHEGDELLAANGIELLGKDLHTATDILASLHGQVVLLVAPAAESQAKLAPTGIIHLRALFSYEPSEDRQLACKELGLSFFKGDILHVTDRRDPDWWQAYRNDESTGITGAVGTLAGLIPSPTFQRQRSILQLRSLYNTNPKEIEWEKEPSDVECTDQFHPVPDQATTKPSKRFLGIKVPFGKGKKAIESGPDSSGSATELSDLGDSDQAADMAAVLVNGALISSIYADRMSNNRFGGGANPPASEGAIEEWSAAGPVWGQHGFEMHRKSRKHLHRRQSNRKSTPCWKALHGEKRSYQAVDSFPFVNPGPDPSFANELDPVAWLEKEIIKAYLPHPCLWTYEPVAQYFPQPLRRRPLIFVGPAHVGRHQLMQNLIKSDPNRFCSVPIVTTNAKLKSDSTVTYEYLSEEAFESERKRGEFIECGVFNRARYGTSRSAVRKLIDAGKVCCITLRPDSLRKLRSTGLLPYVIFISPPERVDEFRHIQKLLGLKATCTDIELISCIEASRKMEERYGHWFDVAVIPESMETTVKELDAIATRLEREPSWIPRYWVGKCFN